MTGPVVALVVALALLAWAVAAFNRLVRLRNQVRNAWADIDVQLQRRHDLVPSLVSAVQAYAGHERALLTTVTQLRAQAVAMSRPAELGPVESELERALVQLLALREAYPDLKSSENFTRLQQDLVDVEDHLQYARRFYNGAVRDYNNTLQRVPDLLIARAGGFKGAEFFQTGALERSAVQVELTR